jgi:hypothetical protein
MSTDGVAGAGPGLVVRHVSEARVQPDLSCPLGLITTFRRLVPGTEAAPVPLVRSGISEIAMTRRQDFALLTN